MDNDPNTAGWSNTITSIDPPLINSYTIASNKSYILSGTAIEPINIHELSERLKLVEKIIGIPERNLKLEKQYPSLKVKFDDYIKILEKCYTLEMIKGETK